MIGHHMTTGMIAPGQVTSLASGTTTSSTISLTWTTPTIGSRPFVYSAYTAPHGTSTWTKNSGTFISTGGTLIGLSTSTSYDIKVIVSGPGGIGSPTTLIGILYITL